MAENLSTDPNNEMDEISKETLISLLKDKSKELKSKSLKLEKLEESYKK
jgi:hypothetical protein